MGLRSTKVDGPWIAEHGSRMPSGHWWWQVRHTLSGAVLKVAYDKQWHAQDEADRLNRMVREYKLLLAEIADLERTAPPEHAGWSEQ